MEKVRAVAALGHSGLLAPARIRAALAANDRLKFTLTVLQAAASRAGDPASAPLDLHRDYATARMEAPWLLDIPASAWSRDGELHHDDLARLCDLLRADIQVMARPLEDSDRAAHRALTARVSTWCEWLAGRRAGALSQAEITLLTSGKRGGEDSFHLLVMDLHKALNRLAAEVSSETIDGAHAWSLEPADRPRSCAGSTARAG